MIPPGILGPYDRLDHAAEATLPRARRSRSEAELRASSAASLRKRRSRPRVQLAGIDRRADRATGLAHMPAVGEAAAGGDLGHIGEDLGDAADSASASCGSRMPSGVSISQPPRVEPDASTARS